MTTCHVCQKELLNLGSVPENYEYLIKPEDFLLYFHQYTDKDCLSLRNIEVKQAEKEVRNHYKYIVNRQPDGSLIYITHENGKLHDFTVFDENKKQTGYRLMFSGDYEWPQHVWSYKNGKEEYHEVYGAGRKLFLSEDRVNNSCKKF